MNGRTDNEKPPEHLAGSPHLTKQENAGFVDLWPALANDNLELRDEYTEDALHLNGAGFAVWVIG